MIEANKVLYDDISEYRAPSETLVGKDILLEEVYERIERAETAEQKSEILCALDLRNCLILGLNLDGVVFSDAPLDQPPDLSGAFFAECSLVGSNFCGCRLSSARFAKCDLSNSWFILAQLEGATIDESDLDNANFSEANFAGIGLYRNRYQAGVHKQLNDGTDTVQKSIVDRLFDWSLIRFISAIPLFGVSWIGFLGSLSLINAIGFANIYHNKLSFLVGPIEVPYGLVNVLITTVFLTIASSLYRLTCPGRVQEFSETQWVEQNNFPRLQYFEKSLEKRIRFRVFQMLIYLTLAIGLTLTLMLVFERTQLAFCYWDQPDTAASCHQVTD